MGALDPNAKERAMTTETGGAEPEGEKKPSRRWQAPFLGVLFIVAGLAFLAASWFPKATVERLWPLFLLIPVAALGQQYLEKGRAAAGVLVPVGVLLYLTGFFLWLNFTSWERTAVTWPNFLLAPALGLFLEFLATRKTALLVPVAVLTVVAAVLLAGFHRSTLAIAVALIAVGALLLIGPALRGRKG
jgi:hypothetical protein